MMTFINILIVAIWNSRQAFKADGKGNMPLQSDKLADHIWAYTNPKVRFLFKNKKIFHFRTDFRQILSSKPHNFSQSGPIYLIILYI